MLFLDMLEAIPCSSYVSLLNKPQPIHHLKTVHQLWTFFQINSRRKSQILKEA